MLVDALEKQQSFSNKEESTGSKTADRESPQKSEPPAMDIGSGSSHAQQSIKSVKPLPYE